MLNHFLFKAGVYDHFVERFVLLGWCTVMPCTRLFLVLFLKGIYFVLLVLL